MLRAEGLLPDGQGALEQGLSPGIGTVWCRAGRDCWAGGRGGMVRAKGFSLMGRAGTQGLGRA